MGVLFGLSTALSWGLEDYLLAVASRRIGALAALLGLHFASIAVLAAFVAGDVESGVLDPSQAGVLLVVGLVGGAGYLCFLRALMLGPVSIVSAVVSGYAVVILLWAFAVFGERPGRAEGVGVAVTLVGVTLAALRVGELRELRRGIPGLWLSLIATVTLGSWIFAIQAYGDEVGVFASLIVGRTASAVLLVAIFLGHGARTFSLRTSTLAVVAGLLDTLGYALFHVGAAHEQMGIVAVASSTYFLVPVALGVWLLRERPAATQWFGIALIAAGLIVLGAAG